MTLFPEMIENAMEVSITGRAIKAGRIALNAVNIRDYAQNKHNRVDDYPYGGGAGMVMQAAPVYRCYQAIDQEYALKEKKTRVIYLSPQGETFSQKMAQELANEEDLEEIVTDYVSIGDYVLTGGELPALVMMDTISRLVPGVLNNDISAQTESFSDDLLEYPQYTRPEEWNGKKVPPVLLSGNHKLLAQWYREQSVIRTAQRRPDLIQKADLTAKEQELVKEILEDRKQQK